MFYASDAHNQTLKNIKKMIDKKYPEIFQTLTETIELGENAFTFKCPKGTKNQIRYYFKNYGYQIYDAGNGYLTISW